MHKASFHRRKIVERKPNYAEYFIKNVLFKSISKNPISFVIFGTAGLSIIVKYASKAAKSEDELHASPFALTTRGKADKYELKVESINEKFDKFVDTIARSTDGVKAVRDWKKRSLQLKTHHPATIAATPEQTKILVDIYKKYDSLSRNLYAEKCAFSRMEVTKVVDSAMVVGAKSETKEISADAEKADISDLERKQNTSVIVDDRKEEKLTELARRDFEAIRACVDDVVKVLTPEQIEALKKEFAESTKDAESARIEVSKSAQSLAVHPVERLFSILLGPKHTKTKVFVLSFPGDIVASQVFAFREEITGVLLRAREMVMPGETMDSVRVVILLSSGGGTVTGYGLAAAQIARLKAAGVHVTVCVDEVAASGGYMMACLADTLIAAPFAVLGSIGVVSTVPNFAKRLEREGISVEDITAGKYKRTMTPYKTPSKEDRSKVQEDINNVLVLFKSHIAKYRPALDVDALATGETWFGTEAIGKGLCDGLGTSDDYLLAMRRQGADLYRVEYRLKSQNPFQNILSVDSDSTLGKGNAMGENENMLQYLQNAVLSYLFSWMARRINEQVDRQGFFDMGGFTAPSVVDPWSRRRMAHESSLEHMQQASSQMSPVHKDVLSGLEGVIGADSGASAAGINGSHVVGTAGGRPNAATEQMKRRFMAVDMTGKGDWGL